MDREDRWSIYLKERYENELRKINTIDPIVANFADILETKGLKRVTDIGCGLGRHSIYLAKRGFQVYGCDLSELVLQKAEDISIQKEAKIQFVQADFMNLPFFNDVFGGVLAIDVLHHDVLENIVKALKEIYRVLIPGGIIAINPLSSRDGLLGNGRKLGEKLYIIHRLPHYFFDRQELESILGKLYFEIESFEVRNFIQLREGQEIFREKFIVTAKKIPRKLGYINSTKRTFY